MEDVKPWKKELILTLFKRQGKLRIALFGMTAIGVALFVLMCIYGFKLHAQNGQAFEWNDYVDHLALFLFTFAFHTVLTLSIYKKYVDNKKQLRELITGRKENILTAMNRFSEPIDKEILRYYEEFSDERKIRVYPRGMMRRFRECSNRSKH